jgi:hypothetical protein
MAKQTVDVGTSASDGTGDDLRVAFTKINENFDELYSGNLEVTAANILVYSVAGRTGNVVLTVNDVAQAASKSYVNTSIASNLANVTGSITNSINANVAAANTVISNHSARITTLESNARAQASQINSLVTVKANVAYVDASIDNALGNAAVSVQFSQINANLAAANAAIASKANGSAHTFSGNVTANWLLANVNLEVEDHIIVGPAHDTGQTWANPAGLFFGNSYGTLTNRYYQINLQNQDSLGSGDIVVTADNGNDATHYVTFGMAGSQYNDPDYPDVLANESYVWTTGGNLLLNSQSEALKLQTNGTTRIEVTYDGYIKLLVGTQFVFPDGTIQSTAFVGNPDLDPIYANLSETGYTISVLQSNAGTQQTNINSLLANAATQAITLNTLTANAATQASALSVLTANAIVQDTLINNLSANITAANANAATQATLISSTQANITAANIRIATIDANLGSQSLSIDNLFSNAASQGNILNTLTANAASQAITLNTLTANAASQAATLDTLSACVHTNTNSIGNLTANAGVQSIDIDILKGNVTTIDVTLGSLITNASSQQNSIITLTSNAATQAILISSTQANITAANINIATIYDLIDLGNTSIGDIISNLDSIQSNLVYTANTATGAIFNGNVEASYLIANANILVSNTLQVGNLSTIDYPGLGGVFVGNTNSYYQVVVQNLSSGNQASGDFVITADNGNDTNRYLGIGINSSGFSGNFTVPYGDTNLPESPYDGHMTVIGGNAVLRTDSNVFLVANTSAVSLNKDGNFILIKSNLEFSDGTVQSSALDLQAVTGNIIPAANVTYTLGNVDYQWKEIHVAGNTIYMGGIPLSASYIDEAGSLTLGANSYIQFSSFADVPENTLHDVVAIRPGYDSGIEQSNFVFASNGAMIVNPNFRILPRFGLSSGDPDQASGNITIGNLIALSTVIGNVSYTPNNASNYNATITNIQQALDELAARLKALGG